MEKKMSSKKIFAIMSLMAVIAMLMAACGTAAAPTKAPTTGEKALTITGVVFQDDQFMKSMVQGYEDAGAKYGIKVLTANMSHDQAKEAELIQTCIAQGVNGIAIGGNPEASRLSGIDVGYIKIFGFIAVQLMAVLSGFMTSGQVMAGSFTFGKGWELDVIAAVVVGGTAFSGGSGTIWGTLVGVIFMGVIINGMTLLNIDVHTQYIVKAVIMFLAVLLSSYRAKIKA
jgi:ABC-type xylose transport system permease subunit